jgi:hypothetical protein
VEWVNIHSEYSRLLEKRSYCNKRVAETQKAVEIIDLDLLSLQRQKFASHKEHKTIEKRLQNNGYYTLIIEIDEAERRKAESENIRRILERTAGMIESEHRRLTFDLATCLAEKSTMKTNLADQKQLLEEQLKQYNANIDFTGIDFMDPDALEIWINNYF